MKIIYILLQGLRNPQSIVTNLSAKTFWQRKRADPSGPLQICLVTRAHWTSEYDAHPSHTKHTEASQNMKAAKKRTKKEKRVCISILILGALWEIWRASLEFLGEVWLREHGRTKILTTGSLIIHFLPELLENELIPGHKKNETD